jgi:3-hydroxyacyl-[acyl-carrier-protein] dehydratase
MRTLKDEVLASTDARIRTLEEEQGFELVFGISTDFTGFSGHFPGLPILPAFIQLLMGQCALEIHSQRRWSLRCVKRAKFMKTITPGQEVTVRWREQRLEDRLRGSFTLTVNDQKTASFSVEFAETGDPDA